MGSEMHRARRSPTAVACACAAALVALGMLLAAVAVRAEDGVVISLGFDVDVAPPQPELVRNQDEVRFGAAIASSPDGESAIFYGGLHGDPGPGNVPRSDAWSFDGATWQPLCGIAGLPPCAPGPRMFHAMATGPTGVVLYGGSPTGVGEGAANVIREDAWVWNGTTWHLFCASCPPGPRAGAAMAGDGTRLLLFGGLDESPQAKNDTWSFDGEQWQLVGDGVRTRPRRASVRASSGTASASSCSAAASSSARTGSRSRRATPGRGTPRRGRRSARTTTPADRRRASSAGSRTSRARTRRGMGLARRRQALRRRSRRGSRRRRIPVLPFLSVFPLLASRNAACEAVFVASCPAPGSSPFLMTQTWRVGFDADRDGAPDPCPPPPPSLPVVALGYDDATPMLAPPLTSNCGYRFAPGIAPTPDDAHALFYGGIFVGGPGTAAAQADAWSRDGA